MTPKEELAKRAVASKHWRWTDGAVNQHGKRFVAGRGFPRQVSVFAGLENYRYANESDLPNLSDPATLGCLLDLVRAAWGSDEIYISKSLGWSALNRGGALMNSGFDSEAEALVEALELAP